MISFTLPKSARSAIRIVSFDDVVELAAGGLGDRAQVPEHLMRLRLDAVDQIAGGGIEPELPRQVDGVAGANALRVRARARPARASSGSLLSAWVSLLEWSVK